MVLFSGMLPSSIAFMIGKGRSWPHFTLLYSQTMHGKGRIGCGGSLHVKENLR
jgi:hypothetical protein